MERFYPEHDALIRDPEAHEAEGLSDSDLCCGHDGEVLLRNFSIEEAQHSFGREGARIVIKCPACGSHNLLAAAVEKLPDGSWVTLPGGKK